ncbi:MAG: Ldh family oxidoreductase [Chloroflexota bacterium]
MATSRALVVGRLSRYYPGDNPASTHEGEAMEHEEVRMSWKDLHRFVTEICVRVGMTASDAACEADALLWANLRGVDSHGVLRLPWYLDNVERGIMNPTPDIRTVMETEATALIEADRAFGPVVTTPAVDLAVRKAHHAGIGWVLIRNHTHQGALGYYVEKIMEKNMAGLAIACARPNMVPFGAKAAGLNNSPLAICVPAGRHAPLLLDMATSVVALGKVMVAANKGEPIPEGWAVDEEGQATTDPSKAEALVPLGGAKGSGMALLFECLASIMAGNALVQPILSTASRRGAEQQSDQGRQVGHIASHNQNSIVAAMHISQFMDLEEYKSQVDDLIDSIKNLPRANGFAEILVPGERKERCYAERIKSGIPLATQTLGSLRAAAERLDVPLPDSM